ncbi:hypothetical protein FRX31_015891 [Thalictrum thalictroides]|uniref:Uncharacterized protein n=1 Tax=Thalictrum thalictroides TaxID=46969 RepID=A0A7J6WB47_THATH|nr:hypothetical protein FRX31_015891 [Thalictrum thalictroides]
MSTMYMVYKGLKGLKGGSVHHVGGVFSLLTDIKIPNFKKKRLKYLICVGFRAWKLKPTNDDQQNLILLYEVDTVVDWFRVWPAKSGNDLMVHVWSFLPSAVTWVVWKHKNNQVFDDVGVQIEKMEREIKVLTYMVLVRHKAREKKV